jgi:hypothetical protein
VGLAHDSELAVATCARKTIACGTGDRLPRQCHCGIGMARHQSWELRGNTRERRHENLRLVTGARVGPSGSRMGASDPRPKPRVRRSLILLRWSYRPHTRSDRFAGRGFCRGCASPAILTGRARRQFYVFLPQRRVRGCGRMRLQLL